MNNEDFIRELTRSNSHANLSSSELEDMAKRASKMFLVEDTPLTEAVVKVAQEKAGISTEQVKRVVEMANTSTFQRLFEKSAGDKNIVFKIAEPSEVLRIFNSSASAPIIKVASDYASRPPSSQTKDLEADMALCSAFGITPIATESLEKAAMIDPAKGQAALEILAQKEQTMKAQKKVIEMQMQPPEPIGPPDMTQIGANVRPPLQAPAQPMMGKMASAEEDFLEVTANMDPSALMDLKRHLVAQKLQDDSQERVVHHGLAGAMTGGLKGTVAGGLAGAVAGGLSSGPGLAQRATGALSRGLQLAGYGGAIGALGGGAGGVAEAMNANRGIADRLEGLQKQAMAYVKSNRPDSDLIKADLQNRYSLDAIKTASQSNDLSYPEANPFGDLFRTRQALSKYAEDVQSAVDENEYNMKQAQEELNHQVVQHVLNGGNLGEVAQLFSGMGSAGHIKEAMAGVASSLESRLPTWQLTNLQTGLIEYEMTKGASARIVNPEHPISRAFSGFIKLAEAHEILKQAQSETVSLLNDANKLVAETVKTRVKSC